MPVLFDPQLFGPPDLFGQSPKKSGGNWPVFGRSRMRSRYSVQP